ncbi:MAG: hypothetical protein Q9160_007865 [Pyrenula sp. 1 TL-2023]
MLGLQAWHRNYYDYKHGSSESKKKEAKQYNQSSRRAAPLKQAQKHVYDACFIPEVERELILFRWARIEHEKEYFAYTKILEAEQGRRILRCYGRHFTTSWLKGEGSSFTRYPILLLEHVNGTNLDVYFERAKILKPKEPVQRLLKSIIEEFLECVNTFPCYNFFCEDIHLHSFLVCRPSRDEQQRTQVIVLKDLRFYRYVEHLSPTSRYNEGYRSAQEAQLIKQMKVILYSEPLWRETSILDNLETGRYEYICHQDGSNQGSSNTMDHIRWQIIMDDLWDSAAFEGDNFGPAVGNLLGISRKARATMNRWIQLKPYDWVLFAVSDIAEKNDFDIATAKTEFVYHVCHWMRTETRLAPGEHKIFRPSGKTIWPTFVVKDDSQNDGSTPRRSGRAEEDESEVRLKILLHEYLTAYGKHQRRRIGRAVLERLGYLEGVRGS